MASFTRSITLILAALLASRSVLASPTRPLRARATVTETPAATITPEVIDHGVLDQAGIDALLANLTVKTPSSNTTNANATSTLSSKLRARTSTSSTNGAFLHYFSDIDSSCKPFTVEGPILGIEAGMGSSDIRSLKLTSISGNTTEITGLVS